MTAAGEAIISEYLNERNEVLEDEKKRLNWLQVWYGIGGFRSLIILMSQFYFFSWLVLGVFTLVYLGESDMDAIKKTSGIEFVKFFDMINGFAFFLSVVGAIIVAGLRYDRYFRNAKKEWIEAENRMTDDIRNIVLVSEELLRRHNLIVAKGDEV